MKNRPTSHNKSEIFNHSQADNESHLTQQFITTQKTLTLKKINITLCIEAIVSDTTMGYSGRFGRDLCKVGGNLTGFFPPIF